MKKIQKERVTYLIGAGASANAIPTVADMIEAIYYYKMELNGIRISLPPIEQQGVGKVIERFITEFDNLIIKSRNYSTIDTLAKMYFVEGKDNELNQLKRCLILYFTIEQCIGRFASKQSENINGKKSIPGFFPNTIEHRYSNFIAAIAERSTSSNETFELNGNVAVLSWNYDSQFELSLKNFTGTQLQSLKKQHSVIDGSHSIEDTEVLLRRNEFSLIKLNGTANLLMPNGKESTSIYDDFFVGAWYKVGNEIEVLKSFINGISRHPIIENWDDLDKLPEYTRNLKFAWEYQDGYEVQRQRVQEIVSETKTLVIIGYSFPIFNRKIDIKLISKMKLNKLYIQDINAENIKSTMSNAFPNIRTMTKDPNLIHLEEHTNQFIIPYELSL
jgi:hypothetical protein